MINTITLQYPYSIRQLRVDNPNVSIPDFPNDSTLAQFGLAEVSVPDDPPYDLATQKVISSEPVCGPDGKWSITKTVAALDPEEMPKTIQIMAWQGMLWLSLHGHLQIVEAAVSLLPAHQQVLARMSMQTTEARWRIGDAMVQQIMAGVLGMTPEAIQQAFTEAGAYEWPS